MTTSPPPPTVLGIQASFGFGDRMGLATPGHVAALRHAGPGIAPIFAQQSIREMTRTGRDPQTVMADAQRGMAEAGWQGINGADADHLKTPADVDRTAAAGFVFFTIDPSAHVDDQADTYDATRLRQRYAELRADVGWVEDYRGKQVDLPESGRLEIDELAVLRAGVKYGRAVNAAIELAAYIAGVQTRAGRPHEIELSVDETAQPTTLAEHFIVADRCLRSGMRLVSLAPRFVGNLEKGVDYIGDLDVLERTLRDHAAIAERLGPYKLSLHSGSDKLSMYTVFARATRGRFHVKTAGTSYLEALRVASREEPALFRRICEFSRGRYDVDKATYHVHATLADIPAPSALPDDRALEQVYLECWDGVPSGRGFTAPGRQILHCTFGSVLTDADLGPALRACLQRHPGTYRCVLATHFARHLEALQAGIA